MKSSVTKPAAAVEQCQVKSRKMLLAKNFFEFPVQVQKCHFGKIEKLPK